MKLTSKFIYFGVVFVLLFSWTITSANRASAQETPSILCNLQSASDLQVTILCSPGFASDRDLVYYISPTILNPEMSLEELDFRQGILIFDAAGDGSANLVIQFTQADNGSLNAELYDDRSGDGEVSINFTGENQVEIREQGPAITVRTSRNWWQKDGKTNFNLDIDISAKLRAAYYTYFWDHLKEVQEPYITIHVRDEDEDGRPDYEWRDVRFPVPESWGYYKTQIMVNTEDDETEILNSVLWPYLGTVKPDFDIFTKASYYYSDPPIGMNWELGKIIRVNEFVGSRTNAGNYFIYSTLRAQEFEISVVNFENPFAYYDISNREEFLPTLMIRSVYYPADDPTLAEILKKPSSNPMIDLTYAWRYPSSEADRAKAPIWDYQLALVGSKDYDTIQQIGDLNLYTPNYATFPDWVTENTWDFGYLVVNEGGNQVNSEGIAVWGAIQEQMNPEAYQYLAGERDEISFEQFKEIMTGYRGEFAPELFDTPQLYLSEIDGEIHLYGSRFGVWTVDTKHIIRFADLNKDGYIDQWLYFINDDLQETLFYVGNYLFFEKNGSIHVKQFDENPLVFQASPPREYAEWKSWFERSQSRASETPEGLEGYYQQFTGNDQTLTGADIEDIWFESEAGNIVIDLEQNFTHVGFPLLPVDGKLPQSYAFTIQPGGSVQASAASPASIVVHEIAAQEEVGAKGQRNLLSSALSNAGTIPAFEVNVRVIAINPQDEETLLDEFVLEVVGNDPASIEAEWVPDQSGTWYIKLLVEYKGDLQEKTIPIYVEEGDRYQSSLILAASNRGFSTLTAFGLLGLGALFLAFVIGRVITTTRAKKI